MKTKIAITGLPECNKTLLALALSITTGIPYIRGKTMYEWRKCFNISDPEKIKWKDMLLIASSAFFEHVKIETCFDQFISDETSFRELIWLKSNFAKQNQSKKKYERDRVVEDLEIASVLYAAQQYDFIVHAGLGLHDGYDQMYMKHNLPYKKYSAEIVEKTIMEIANDLCLPMRFSVEDSIYQAKVKLFL